MIVLSGADLVLPDRVVERGTLVIRDGRIEAVESRIVDGPAGATRIDCSGHAHRSRFHRRARPRRRGHRRARRRRRRGRGREPPAEVRRDRVSVRRRWRASRRRWRTLLAAVAAARTVAGAAVCARAAGASREQLHQPRLEWRAAAPLLALAGPARRRDAGEPASSAPRDILDVIARHRTAAGIVTLAPELPGGLDLVRALVAAGHRVSIGHTGATYDEAQGGHRGRRRSCHAPVQSHVVAHVAFAGRGRRRARIGRGRGRDHLRRLPRAPRAGRAGDARQERPAPDGHYRRHRRLGAAGRARARGSAARRSSSTERSAELADGTLAGSVLTMDGAFRRLVQHNGVSLADAVAPVRDDAGRRAGAGRGRVAGRRHDRGSRRPGPRPARAADVPGRDRGLGTLIATRPSMCLRCS